MKKKEKKERRENLHSRLHRTPHQSRKCTDIVKSHRNEIHNPVFPFTRILHHESMGSPWVDSTSVTPLRSGLVC